VIRLYIKVVSLFIFILILTPLSGLTAVASGSNADVKVYLPLIFGSNPDGNTLPNQPFNPNPIDGAVDQDISLILSWMGGDSDGDVVTYDVYLAVGDNTPDILVANDYLYESYSPGSLSPNTTYFWQIVATDQHGAVRTGSVWSFTTGEGANMPPDIPSDPQPIDGAADQDLDLILNWIGGDPDWDALSYDVYFEAGNSMPDVLVSDNQVENSCNSGTLSASTVYYWQVVAIDEHGISTPGPVWSFTTGEGTNTPPNLPSSPSPIDGAVNQELELLLSWVGGDPDGDSVSFDVYFEADDITPDVVVANNQYGESYSPGVLNSNTEYYWQIISTDEHGAFTAGSVWTFTTGEIVLTQTQLLIPGGEFQMGCDPDQNNGMICAQDELPLHPVWLDAYYIDKYEVTNSQYSQCVTAGACSAPYANASETRIDYYINPLYANYPVLEVTWQQAATYCDWRGKRLPTEAEWEKAARGSSDTRTFPWGDQRPGCSLANYIVGFEFGYCIGDTSQVGSYPTGAAPLGALDMAGNLLEWVYDWYQSDYYSFSPYANPDGPLTGMDKVLRGGAWSLGVDGIRVASRIHDSGGYHGNSVGFRCAADPEN